MPKDPLRIRKKELSRLDMTFDIKLHKKENEYEEMGRELRKKYNNLKLVEILMTIIDIRN